MRTLFFAAALAWSAGAFAQAWPTKPVRLITPNSPGVVTDLAARILAEHLSRAVGQPWVVENRPGADGLIGAQELLRSAPDGYTLLYATASTLAINPHTTPNPKIEPERDFTPIAVVVDTTGGFVIVTSGSLPIRTLPQMVAYAKANPGKLTYTTTVPIFVMFGEWLKRRAGIDMVAVPYKNTTQAVQDTLSGVVALGLQAYPTVAPFIKAGKLHVVVSAPVRRLEELPDVPSVAETYPGFMDSWVALVGPAGVPAELVQRINREVAVVVKDPKYNQDLKKINWGSLEGARSPQATVAFIRKEREQWGQIIREIGLKK